MAKKDTHQHTIIMLLYEIAIEAFTNISRYCVSSMLWELVAMLPLLS